MSRAFVMTLCLCLFLGKSGFAQDYVPPEPQLTSLLPFPAPLQVESGVEEWEMNVSEVEGTEVQIAQYNIQDLFADWALIRKKGEEWEAAPLFDGLTERYVYKSERVEINGKGSPELVLYWDAMDGIIGKFSGFNYLEGGIQIWDLDELRCLLSLSTDAVEEQWGSGESCHSHYFKPHVFPGGFFLLGDSSKCNPNPKQIGPHAYFYTPEGWKKGGTTATFTADTTKLMERSGHNPRQFEEIREMRWILNGIPFTWGTPSLEIEVNPFKFDTLLFQRDSVSKWDTILCNITKPNDYLFEYNECCGAFNVRNQASNRFTKGAAEFLQIGESQHKLLGIQGEGAIFLAEKEFLTAPRTCMPAMGSNVEWIQVVEVEEANSVNCKGVPGPNCIFSPTGEPLEDECFNLVKTRTQFLYLFLEAEPLVVQCTKSSVKLKRGRDYRD